MIGDGHSAGRSPRVMNPLWIISLFLGLSEATVGVVAMQSHGPIQNSLTAFAVLFPLIVSIGFFWIVWKRPYVLYAPGDFTEQTSVTAYVEAMHFAGSQPPSAIEEIVKSVVESIIPKITERNIDARERDTVIDYALEVTRKDLARRTIGVDVHSLTTRSETPASIHIAVNDSTTISEFLDHVWVALDYILEDPIPEYSYGARWILRDPITGGPIRNIGTRWAKNNGMTRDSRLLAEAGIAVGSQLAVEMLTTTGGVS